MAEIEYQVDEMLFKMNALSGTSGLPEKVPFYPTDSEPNSESLPGSEVSTRTQHIIAPWLPLSK